MTIGTGLAVHQISVIFLVAAGVDISDLTVSTLAYAKFVVSIATTCLPENQLNLLIGKYGSTTEYREAPPLVSPIPVIKGPGVLRYCTFLEFNNDNNLVGYTSPSDEGRESCRRCASSSSRAIVSSISYRNPASPTRPMRFYGCHDGNALRRL